MEGVLHSDEVFQTDLTRASEKGRTPNMIWTDLPFRKSRDTIKGPSTP